MLLQIPTVRRIRRRSFRCVTRGWKRLLRSQKPAATPHLQKETAYDVQVRLGTEQFETRYYDTFTLPAGEYPALRVNLGKAQGHNWWCVVFPSLCTAATSDALERTAAVGGFDSEETELIEGGEEAYELRFKSFEWLQALLDWIS